MDMRTSFDSRDDRHAYVGYVFQNLSAFVVNLAPDTGIGNIAKRVPIDPNNEVALCTRQYDDFVLPDLAQSDERHPRPPYGVVPRKCTVRHCCEIRQPARRWYLASSSWCDRHRSSQLDGFAWHSPWIAWLGSK